MRHRWKALLKLYPLVMLDCRRKHNDNHQTPMRVACYTLHRILCRRRTLDLRLRLCLSIHSVLFISPRWETTDRGQLNGDV